MPGIIKTLSKLLPVRRNAIRRYHGTSLDHAQSILDNGLLVNSPNTRIDDKELLSRPDYPGIYTTTQPSGAYFWYNTPGEALVVLDLPKSWYRLAPRKAYNPELPNPPPKLPRWDEIGQKQAQLEYDRLHPTDDANPYNLPEGWGDTPYDRYTTYRNVVPVQQGGRTDIFDVDIPPEYITDILTPLDEHHSRSLLHPDILAPWDMFEYFK